MNKSFERQRKILIENKNNNYWDKKKLDQKHQNYDAVLERRKSKDLKLKQHLRDLSNTSRQKMENADDLRQRRLSQA
jgi:hypothetical protein